STLICPLLSAPSALSSLSLRAALPIYQTELARYNIELNVPPQPFPGDAVLHLEDMMRTSVTEADAKAAIHGAQIVMIGILPTLRDRKSTRLNSSHVSISYAVFCLKKKR